MNWKEKFTSKCIYFFSLLAMCSLLISVSYIFFLRTYDIDIESCAQIVYTGENGYASASVLTHSDNLNQRTQEFLDSIVYEITPDTNLANGDTIEIRASYDEELASVYHFLPVNTAFTAEVSGLYNRYAAADQIPQTFLEEADEKALSYVKSHSRQIFNAYILQPLAAAMEMKATPLYTAFLRSENTRYSDRLLYLYQLDFDNVSQSYTIFYLVTIYNINDSDEITEENLYGEKAYLSSGEISRHAYASFVSRLYASDFQIETLYEKEEQPVKPAVQQETEEEEENAETDAE